MIENDANGIYALRSEDYKPFVETLGGNSYSADYLSWSVCWDKLKELYPTARHEWVHYMYGDKPYFGVMQPDGSVTVHCKITYETEDGNTYYHDEYLAVRDFRNNAVQNPDSAQMENTYRRALAKGVSTLTGFGIELWMNEDIRELQTYRPQTLSSGKRPVPGGIKVDQSVKLDALMRDNNCPPDDKARIKKMKEMGWEGVDEKVATIIIADVKQGIKNNKPLTPTRIKKFTKAISDSELPDDQKMKALEWVDGKRSNLDLDTFVNKLIKEGVLTDAV